MEQLAKVWEHNKPPVHSRRSFLSIGTALKRKHRTRYALHYRSTDYILNILRTVNPPAPRRSAIFAHSQFNKQDDHHMNPRRLSLLILFFFSWSLYGQSASQPTPNSSVINALTDPFWRPTIIRDKKAVSALNAALSAMGGTEAVRNITSLAIEGHDSGVPGNTFLWQLSGPQYRIYIQDNSAHYEINSGSGQSFRDSNGTVTSRAGYISAATIIPAALATELYNISNNPSYSIIYGGTTSINGVTVSSITTALETSRTVAYATSQTWYISTATNFPVKLSYRLFDETKWLSAVDASYLFSDFAQSESIYFPHTITALIHGNVCETRVLTAVIINPSLPQSLFPPNEVSSK
jgi:hypothetical protein